VRGYMDKKVNVLISERIIMNNYQPSLFLRIFKRLWGLIPYFIFFLLVVVIFQYYERIQIEKKALEAQKLADAKKEETIINVVTLDVKPVTIRDRMTLPGVTDAWTRLEVLAEVRGKVIAEHIKEGQFIKKGQALITLDARDYKNAYQSVKASYNAALASWKRINELFLNQLSTKSELDNASADVERLKAELDTSSLNLERCVIRAPIAGIINCRCVNEGGYVNASEKVVEIIQITRIKVKVGIPESDVDSVRKLTKFNITIDALDNKVFHGTKYFLSKTADPMAHLYNLEIALTNPKHEILPDMFTRVEIVKRVVPNGFTVPLYAIISKDYDHFVYVVKDGKAETRKVSLGLQEGFYIEIKKGLQEGEQVIVVGHRDVNNGQHVNIVRTITHIKDIES